MLRASPSTGRLRQGLCTAWRCSAGSRRSSPYRRGRGLLDDRRPRTADPRGAGARGVPGALARGAGVGAGVSARAVRAVRPARGVLGRAWRRRRGVHRAGLRGSAAVLHSADVRRRPARVGVAHAHGWHRRGPGGAGVIHAAGQKLG